MPAPLPSLLLAIGCAAAVLSANPLAAEDLKPLSVVLSYVPNVENFGALYAKANGLFEEAGLDVTLIPGGQGIDQVQMVASGVAHLGMTAGEGVVAAIDKGAALKVIGGQFQKSPIAMTCRKDSGITEPSQVKGRKVGVKQAAQVYAETFFGKNGVKMDEIEVTSIGNSDISLLIAGRIECMITTFAFNEPRLIQQAGVDVTVIPVGDFGMNSQSGAWIVTDEFLAGAGNKEMLAAYMSAEAKAWEVYFADPAAAAKFVIDGKFNDGLNLEQQTFQAVEQAKFMVSPETAEKGILWVNMAAWEQTAQNAVEAGAAAKYIDPASFTTTEILEAATLPKH